MKIKFDTRVEIGRSYEFEIDKLDFKDFASVQRACKEHMIEAFCIKEIGSREYLIPSSVGKNYENGNSLFRI